MGFRYYLVIKDFYGNGSDLKSDLLSFSWGSSQSPSMGGSGSQKVQVSDITVSRVQDKDSPLLAQAVATGRPLDKVIIVMEWDSPDGLKPFQQIEMSNVIISSMQVSGSKSGQLKPIETLTFNFEKVSQKYVAEKYTGVSP